MRTSVAKPADGTPPTETTDSTAQEIVDKLTPILRPEQRRQAERVIGMVLQKTHSGPLPPPEDLAHYDAICPGAAARILSMAERNMEHRHTTETRLIQSEYGLRTRGQWFALAALIVMLSVIAFTFWLKQPVAGSVLGSATLIAITGMFLGRERAIEEAQPEPARPQPRSGKNRKRR